MRGKPTRAMVRVALLGTVCLTAACTTQQTSFRVDNNYDRNAAKDNQKPAPAFMAKGLVYYLPTTELVVHVTRKVDACTWRQWELKTDMMPSDAFKKYGEALTEKPENENEIELIISVQASLESRVYPDRNRAFVIDPEFLTYWTKTTSQTLTLKDGMLKSVDATATDKSQVVVGNVFQTALTLAGIPAAEPSNKFNLELNNDELQKIIEKLGLNRKSNLWVPAEKGLCSDTVVNALAQIEDLEPKVKKAEAERDKTSADIAFTLASGAKVDDAKKLLLKTQAKAAEDLKAMLAEAVAKVTFKQSYLRRPTLGKLPIAQADQPLPMDQATVRRIFAPSLMAGADVPTANGVALLPAGPGSVPAVLTQYVAVAGANFASLPAEPEVKGNMPVGIVYRQPARADVLVCKTKACVDGEGVPVAPADRILDTPVMFPQLGVMASLDLTNGFAQDNKMGIEFGADGSITKFSFDDQERATATTQMLLDNAQKLSDFAKARQEQKKAAEVPELDALKAENAKLQALIDQEKLKQELLKLRGGAAPAQPSS